ncbi:FecR family protein [Limibacterium fermenti]|uniref:FecR family protein n=1 Tax=Limibacterium fermenti TaxID=3229863 RepID=UPI003A6B21D4
MEKAERQLLEDFIAGRCTKEELVQVNLLLKSKKGQQMLDELLEEREAADWNNPPEEDEAMQELVRAKQAEMQERIAAYERRRPFSVNFIRWGSYAAVFAGILVLTTLVLWQGPKGGYFGGNQPQYVEITNSGGLPERHLLPDSTEVYLAAGSTLKYPETFSKTGRNIELQGEAFFDVKRDEARPFTIRSGNMETRVLGTSFKVTAFAGQEQEVAVATGKVSVRSVNEEKAAEPVLLTRGLKVNYNPQTGEVKTGEVDVHSLEQWKSGTLIFNEQTMSLIARQLEGRYGVQIGFSDQKIANHRVSGTFAAGEAVTEILDMLGFVGKFRYETTDDGKKFVIRDEN